MKTRIKMVTTNGKRKYTAQRKGLKEGWSILWYLFPVLGQMAFFIDIFSFTDMKMYSTVTYDCLVDATFESRGECVDFLNHYIVRGDIPPSTVTESVEYLKY